MLEALNRIDRYQASRRSMSLTPDLVALCERSEHADKNDQEVFPSPTLDFEGLARRLANESAGQPLWAFAYGSLIWKPAFEAVEQRRGVVFGWHRAFCLELTSWRASSSRPGLMMALQRGGRCAGVVYRLRDEDRTSQIERLLRREIDAEEHSASIRWVRVRTTDGPIRALAFWVGPSGNEVVPRLPSETITERLAHACGPAGSCADYLYRTVLHLEMHGIRDGNLWRLQELVAAEIRRLHGVSV